MVAWPGDRSPVPYALALVIHGGLGLRHLDDWLYP
jgi:hypothetical protein